MAGRIRGTRPVTYKNMRFHSTREANRYRELELLRMARQITGLRRQVPFEFVINGVPIKTATGRTMRYEADFVYFDIEGKPVIEDAKGHRTDVYRIKKAIMAAMGHEIVEV